MVGVPVGVSTDVDRTVGGAPVVDLVDPERRTDGVNVVGDVAARIAVGGRPELSTTGANGR